MAETNILMMANTNAPSAESILKLVKRAPKRSHAALPTPKDAALRYTLTLAPAKERGLELQQAVGELPGFDLEQIEPTRFSVVHASHWTATHIGDAGMAGKNASYIEDPDGGFRYADHTDQFQFYADKEQVVPLAPPAALQATIETEDGEPIEGRATKVATVLVSVPAAVRLRIWFINEAAVQPFAREVLSRLVGCPTRLKKSGVDVDRLEQLGLPVRMESYAAGHAREPLVVSTITDLKLGHATRKEFEVPESYHDLRDTSGLAKRVGQRGFQAGGGRLSLSRAGYTEYNRPTQAKTPAASVAYSSSTIRLPQCLPSTFAAQVALDTDQLFYDDVRFLINNLLSRLSSFSGSGGTLLVDWLNQWTNSGNVAAGDDGLYCLMHTSALGTGLLDKLAESKVRGAMIDGSITSIGLTMPAALLAQVTAALLLPANQRFDSLPAASQTQLRDLYLVQLIGQFTVTYPTSTPSTTTFYGLINVQLSDIEFNLNLNYTKPMTSLDADNNAIRMHLALPAVTGSANIARWPTALYWAVLGATGLACLFLPFLCALLPYVVAVGLFLLTDYAYVRVEIDNFTCDATISFQPDPMQVMRPQAALHLDGDVSVWYMSYIPTGLHQLASFVYSLVGSHTDIVINLIEAQLQGSLNTLLGKTLNLSFPPQFGPVPIVGIDSSTDGQLDNFLYLEAGLDAAVVGISAPYITQVASDIEAPMLAGRLQSANDSAGHPMFRAYGGFVVSQNILNYYINTIWRLGAFNYTLSAAEAHKIALSLPHTLHLQNATLNVHLWPAVTPRTVLTPYADFKVHTYAATFFDDVRLCISILDQSGAELIDKLELQFAAEANTQIGLGSVNPSFNPPKLDITRVTDTFLDLYFDLARLRVKLVHPEVQGLASTGSIFSSLTVADLPHLQNVMLMALGFALKTRDDQFIPSPTGDARLQQYAIPGATIDFHLKPNRGNIYAWIGVSGTPVQVLNNTYYGLLALFPNGPLDISTIDCVTGRLLAVLI